MISNSPKKGRTALTPFVSLRTIPLISQFNSQAFASLVARLLITATALIETGVLTTPGISPSLTT
jgi:hypothetical protein